MRQTGVLHDRVPARVSPWGFLERCGRTPLRSCVDRALGPDGALASTGRAERGLLESVDATRRLPADSDGKSVGLVVQPDAKQRRENT
jgi:hypothetical protein